MPSATKTPSPVSHGTVQKTPVTSPVLLPGQIACPLCKIGCNDKNVVLGHTSAEHLAYKFLCDELNCNKVYISKSGLFKHKKTYVQEETDDSVLCMDCQQTFKTEVDCDNHDCPTLTPRKKQNDIQNPNIKTECPPENGETSSNGKTRTRSKIKKEPL